MPQLQWQLLLWKQNTSPQSVFSFFLLFGHLEHLSVRKDECKKLWGTASCPCWKDSFRCGRKQAVIDGAQPNLLPQSLSPVGTARPTSEQAQCHPSIWTWYMQPSDHVGESDLFAEGRSPRLKHPNSCLSWSLHACG